MFIVHTFAHGFVRRAFSIANFRAVAAGMLCVAIPLGGCSPYRTDLPVDTTESVAWARINHLHNDADQKNADDAYTQFQAFTSQTAGLGPLLDKNLTAQQSLEQPVSATRLQVLDTELANATTDVSWNRLRARLLDSVGILDQIDYLESAGHEFAVDPMDPSVPEEVLAAAVERYQLELQVRIAGRGARLAEVAKVLRLIVAAQGMLLQQAQANVAANKKQTAKIQQAATQPAIDTITLHAQALNAAVAARQREQDQTAIVNWTQQLLGALAHVGSTVKSNLAAMATATNQPAQIFAAAEASRDPATAYALTLIQHLVAAEQNLNQTSQKQSGKTPPKKLAVPTPPLKTKA